MRLDIGNPEKGTSKSNSVVYGIVALCLLLLFGVLSCRRRTDLAKPARPSPPDLSRCTRLEIYFYPSTLDYLFPSTVRPGILNSEETQYIESLKPVTVVDKRSLKALAHDVSSGSYVGTGGAISAECKAHVVCHDRAKRSTSFDVFAFGVSICTDEGNWFNYPKNVNLMGTLETLATQTRPFALRAGCARSIRTLWYPLRELHRRSLEWCDDTKPALRDRDYIGGGHPFKCPSAGEGKCHYAMNPNCDPNSPPDTVLLFETKAGWNRHGGPELFTFDNHDPRGGCILFSDGTVKFIRTNEELQQLRWK